MLVNQSSLKTLFDGFSTSFNKGIEAAESHYNSVSMTVPSSASETTYGWLGQFPKIREWVGDRVVNNLQAHGYTVKNRKFENTISVSRDSIEDDQYGIYGPLFQEMGKTTAEFPDELIFSLLGAGFSTTCYDGQYFFDADHPVGGETGVVSVSNMQAGAGPAWFLLDTTRAIKPMLWQTRIPFNFTRLDKDGDENVFWRDEYVYGVRGRANAGFGLWQLAFGSKADLDATNYAAARKAMMEMKGDAGRPLNIKPKLLIVPPALESAARKLVNSEYGTGGVTNEWKGTADLVVTPWIA